MRIIRKWDILAVIQVHVIFAGKHMYLDTKDICRSRRTAILGNKRVIYIYINPALIIH